MVGKLLTTIVSAGASVYGDFQEIQCNRNRCIRYIYLALKLALDAVCGWQAEGGVFDTNEPDAGSQVRGSYGREGEKNDFTCQRERIVMNAYFHDANTALPSSAMNLTE